MQRTSEWVPDNTRRYLVEVVSRTITKFSSEAEAIACAKTVRDSELNVMSIDVITEQAETYVTELDGLPLEDVTWDEISFTEF